MSLSGLRRIGLFGGAFDPPHLAHSALAKAAVAQCQLDQLRILPTGQAWHKARDLSDAHHRIDMARLAFADLPEAVVDARETTRAGATFTIDTLTELQAEQPGCEWWLFIGEDQAKRLTTWHRWSDILDRAHVVVAQRPEPADPIARDAAPHGQWHNALPSEVKPKIHVLNWSPQDMSATAIRQALARGQDTVVGLHPKVYRYIRQHHLYSDQHE